MITRALHDYLMKNNYTFGLHDSMSAKNDSSETNDRKGPNIRTKHRREPTLGYNETLLIELGIVVIVVTIVGLVFYCSHRNYKKRSNLHRRRWLESDITIDNYNDGQIYDTNSTLEEYQPETNDQDDSPPTYESVVSQSRVSLKSKRRSKTYKNNLDPLISTQPVNGISTICSEDSSLIENRHSASTSTIDEEFNRLGKYVKNESQVDCHDGLRQSTRIGIEGEKETNAKLDIVPVKMVGHENEIALLDASGLPTYDSALKIQECGNM